MKKVCIFFILLYIATCCFYRPDLVSVGTGVADKFITRLDTFEDSAETAWVHLDLLSELKYSLESLKYSYSVLPDVFTQDGVLQGVLVTLRTLTETVLSVTAAPLYILGVLVVFIVDAISLIFNLFTLIDIFTVNI